MPATRVSLRPRFFPLVPLLASNHNPKMASDYRNLVAVSLAALGVVLFLLTLSVSLSASANLVLRVAAMVLAFGAFIYVMFSGRHVPRGTRRQVRQWLSMSGTITPWGIRAWKYFSTAASLPGIEIASD